MNLEQVKERIKTDYGVEFEDKGDTLETPYMLDTLKGIAIFKNDNRIIAFGLNSSQDTTFTDPDYEKEGWLKDGKLILEKG